MFWVEIQKSTVVLGTNLSQSQIPHLEPRALIQGLEGSEMLLLEFKGGFLKELLDLQGAGAKGCVLSGKMENKA